MRRAGQGVAALFAVLFWLFPTFCLLQPERWRLGEETARAGAPFESAGEPAGESAGEPAGESPGPVSADTLGQGQGGH